MAKSSKPTSKPVSKAKQASKPVNAEAVKKAQAKAARQAAAQLAKVQFEENVKNAFKAAGFTDIRPRVTVKTWSLWAQDGRQPKAGAVPTFVRAPWMTIKQIGYPMFHVSQTAPIPNGGKVRA